MQKQYRLKGEKTFNAVFKKGTSVGSKYLVIIFLQNKGGVKVGFSVSKKVGNSVVRNKVRRRLRASFRLILPKVKSGYNYIVVARKEAALAQYAELDGTIKYLLKKADKLDEALV